MIVFLEQDTSLATSLRSHRRQISQDPEEDAEEEAVATVAFNEESDARHFYQVGDRPIYRQSFVYSSL